jgi:hypothetical protein
MKTSVEEIAYGNLIFIKTLIQTPKHTMMLTEGVRAMEDDAFNELITKVREFNDWTQDNDPDHFKDFGAVIVGGIKYYFKIDLHDHLDRDYGFDMETMPITQCHRVLTIMRSDEY